MLNLPFDVTPDSKIVDVMWLRPGQGKFFGIVLVETQSGNKAYWGQCFGYDEEADALHIYHTGSKIYYAQAAVLAAHLMANREGDEPPNGQNQVTSVDGQKQ